MSDHTQRGQVLPLTALFMTALLLMAALAIDVTGVLSAERFYATTAEAAALAGGQDLQRASSRLIDDTERGRSRGHAMDVLVDRLGATSTPSAGNCSTTNDVVGCALPGTPYLVSVRTPSPSCVLCDPNRSVQVTIRNPAYGLTFAGLAGMDSWNVQADAVAGLQFSGRYAVQTLRPPHPLPNGADQNRENISVDGTNTWVHVPRGDIGTNTSAYTNSGGLITLATGYRIDHFDDIVPDPWNKLNGLPEGKLLRKKITDPAYMIADFEGLPEPSQGKPKAPEYATQEDGQWDAVTGDTNACPAPGTNGFPPLQVDGEDQYEEYLDDPALTVTCYMPGVYLDAQGFNVSQNTEVAYLLPGAYYFGRKGIDIGGTLLGGLVRGEPGVVLVVPQTADFAGNNSVAIILNHGTEDCDAESCRSTPAIDWSGDEVVSPEGLVITIEVPRPTDPADDICFDGVVALDVAKCSTSNNTLNLPGNGNLSVVGIVYAPSDNAQINGNNTSQVGEVGQLIAWTVKYSGGAKLIQNYPQPDQVGTVRLDAACTGMEACN